MEDYVPKALQLPQSPGRPSVERVSGDIIRQSSSTRYIVGISSLEINRNKVPKKVKLLDVRVSFSYQDEFTTETDRFEKQLVRHGNKWNWRPSEGEASIISFPYSPGDRVNLNLGIIVYKTKKQGLLSKDTETTQAGTVTECIVLAKNNGVGVGLPMNSYLSHPVKLNFNIDGFGHHMTVKLGIVMQEEMKGYPILWLRPATLETRVHSQNSVLELLKENLPPRICDYQEDFRGTSFICRNQRLVNYTKTAVLECWSIRPASSQTDIPAAIQIRQVTTNRTVAYLIPVLENQGKKSSNVKSPRLSILVISGQGPYCTCSTKWKSSDKFDFKIHYMNTGEIWGQRIKWASRDFIDIDHIIMNSTGHQFVIKQNSNTVLEDVCIGLCLKLLVRWYDEILPWKREHGRPLSVIQPFQASEIGGASNFAFNFNENIRDPTVFIDNLPSFLEARELSLFCDMEDKVNRSDDSQEQPASNSNFVRVGSGSSYEECQDSVNKSKTKSTKCAINPHCDDKDDFTSGFVEDYGYSEIGASSWIDCEQL